MTNVLGLITLNYNEFSSAIWRRLSRHSGGNSERGIHKLRNAPTPISDAQRLPVPALNQKDAVAEFDLGHRRLKQAIRNAEFIGGGGVRTHIRTVPFCPSAQPQGGPSLPPGWGRFLGHSRMQNRPPRHVERQLLGRTGDSGRYGRAANTAVQKTAPAKAIPPLGSFLLGNEKARRLGRADREYSLSAKCRHLAKGQRGCRSTCEHLESVRRL
jgi:hypothetical protein